MNSLRFYWKKKGNEEDRNFDHVTIPDRKPGEAL